MRNKDIVVGMPQISLGNRFKAQVIERRPGHPDEGKVIAETPWASNLILENGMNKLATTSVVGLFRYCAIGTGTTPTFDSSGSITATTSGTTATSSATFFSSADVGKLLRFSTGQKAIITAYIDASNVTLASALGVSTPTTFTNYRIAQTGLDTEVRRSNTYLAGGCGSSLSSATVTHTCTFDFPIETADTYYNEVGFSSIATAGANLNMRAIFAGAPVTVLNQQQIRVIYNVLETVSPVTARSKEFSISGWPSLQHPVTVDPSSGLVTLVAHGFPANMKLFFNGTSAPGGFTFGTSYYVVSNTADTFYVSTTPGGSIVTTTSSGTGVILFTNTQGAEQLLSAATSGLNNDGSLYNFSYILEPASALNTRTTCLSTDTSALPTFPTVALTGNQLASNITGGQQYCTADTYVTGSYTLTYRTTFAAGVGNSSVIRKICLTDNAYYGAFPNYCGLCCFFDRNQEKTNLYTLTIVWRYTWDRNFI